jgi:phosphoribosylamine---glycine ligase
MKVLVIGSGGREHALVKALRASSEVGEIYAWPGNGGILQVAKPVAISANEQTSHAQLVAWAVSAKINLVVIGPELELVLGLSDHFRKSGIDVFGPSQAAAQLEGSKIFAKKFMNEFNVPTAKSFTVESVHETLSAAKNFEAPYVLKADGLAQGKGVYICKALTDLEKAATELFVEKKFGDAGKQALLEEFLPGEELSILALTNGDKFEVLPLCRDHKRLLDGDKGPNTGGMGVVSPISISENLRLQIENEIIKPTLRGLQTRELFFRGVIFIGIMLTAKGPIVLEYNVRFGDPETQAILPQLDGDWARTLLAVSRGEMPSLKWHSSIAVACIVIAAEGYPEKPIRGAAINFGAFYRLAGTAANIASSDLYVLHAGTLSQNQQIVVNGGRVLNVVGVGKSMREAIVKAYAGVVGIKWPGMQYRKDIGFSVEN